MIFLIYLLLPISSAILQDLTDIDLQLYAAAKKIELLQEEQSRIQMSQALATSDLAALQVEHDGNKLQLQKRLRTLARLPFGASLTLLSQSHDANDFMFLTRSLRFFANKDRKLHDSFTQSLGELERRQDAVTQEQIRLEMLVRQEQDARFQLASAEQKKQRLVDHASQDRNMSLKVVEEKNSAQNRLLQWLETQSDNQHNNRSFKALRGRHPRPVEAAVRHYFGDYEDKHFATRIAHEGWTFATKFADEVHSIAQGVVVYADWFHGFGQLVLVDHGDNYHSLYAHLAEVAVKTGQSLEKNEVLGRAGDTGSLDGVKLYFEIRHDSLAMDPRDWLTVPRF